MSRICRRPSPREPGATHQPSPNLRRNPFSHSKSEANPVRPGRSLRSEELKDARNPRVLPGKRSGTRPRPTAVSEIVRASRYEIRAGHCKRGIARRPDDDAPSSEGRPIEPADNSFASTSGTHGKGMCGPSARRLPRGGREGRTLTPRSGRWSGIRSGQGGGEADG